MSPRVRQLIAALEDEREHLRRLEAAIMAELSAMAGQQDTRGKPRRRRGHLRVIAGGAAAAVAGTAAAIALALGLTASLAGGGDPVPLPQSIEVIETQR